MIYPHYDLSACETALRGARARTPARPALCRVACVLSFVVTILLLTSCNIRAAFAAGGGGGGHAFQTPRILQLWEGSELRVVGGLSSGFDAAALLIGYSISDTNSLTVDQRKLLSNPNTGGRFYELSTRFRTYASTGNPIGVAGVDVPNPGASLWIETIDGFANFEYTPSTTWWCQASNDFVNGAKSDYDAVLSGQAGGGSNEPVVGSSYTTVVLDTSVWSKWNTGNSIKVYDSTSFTTYTTYSKPDLISAVGGGLEFEIPNMEYNWLVSESRADGGYDIGITGIDYSDNFGRGYAGIALMAYRLKPNTYTKVDGFSYGNKYTSTQYVYSQAGDSLWSAFYKSGNTIKLRNTIYPSVWRWNYSGNNYYECGPFGWIKNGSYQGPTVIPPDNNWPEDEPEPVPDPPVVPDPPSDPVTPQPPIDPINPQDPIVVGDNPTQVGGTDYTAYLQQIIDDLAAHCQHLQTMMVSVGGYLGSYIANLGDSIGSWFQWLAQYLGSEFKKTRQYLNELFEWLADQFSFELEPYNDTNMLYWLRQIYWKLGQGNGNRPIDPTHDIALTNDWLDLYVNLNLGGLLDISPEVNATYEEAYDKVRTKFPFSVPDDLGMIFGLLVSQPVTPVVNVPMYVIGSNGLQASEPLHIDLTPFDGAMSIVRSMFKLCFIVYCMMHTRELMYFIKGGEV